MAELRAIDLGTRVHGANDPNLETDLAGDPPLAQIVCDANDGIFQVNFSDGTEEVVHGPIENIPLRIVELIHAHTLAPREATQTAPIPDRALSTSDTEGAGTADATATRQEDVAVPTQSDGTLSNVLIGLSAEVAHGDGDTAPMGAARLSATLVLPSPIYVQAGIAYQLLSNSLRVDQASVTWQRLRFDVGIGAILRSSSSPFQFQVGLGGSLGFLSVSGESVQPPGVTDTGWLVAAHLTSLGRWMVIESLALFAEATAAVLPGSPTIRGPEISGQQRVDWTFGKFEMRGSLGMEIVL